MSRLSAFRNLTRGVLRSSRLAQTRSRLLVRCLSDDSDSSFVPPTDRVQGKQRRFEKEKPSTQTSHLFVWPDVKAKNTHHTSLESSESGDDGITATWDFRNNELDVEQLAGLPGPRDAEDPYAAFEEEEEAYEDAEHRQIQDELQFGRMCALREQLTQELDSSGSFTSDERKALSSVRDNVDFMMQELTQISALLRTLYPEQPNATMCSASSGMSQDDCLMGTAYTTPQLDSWPYSSAISNQEVLVKEAKDSETTSQTEAISSETQLSHDQEPEALDEVICDDDSQKPRPDKPSESSPKTDGRQELQPKEPIHTYRPFRTIDVPVTKPTRSLSSQANTRGTAVQEEASVAETTDNPLMGQGYSVSAQLSESESRILMRMALKQALSDLESGKNIYKATVLVANDEESHAED